MRPVERGDAPQSYPKYQDAIGDLEEKLGTYCSYCERRLPISLAVEHVVPKSLDSSLETVWDNFLLGCPNCNSVKGKQATNFTEFLWPDQDNTFLAFQYKKGGFVEVAATLDSTVKTKAEKLMKVVGLDRHQNLRGHGHEKPASRDKRWLQREEAWAAAERCRENVKKLQGDTFAKELAIEVAIAKGFFSVWMTVFHDDVYIKTELIKRFKGTAASCFDSEGNAVSRPEGQL